MARADDLVTFHGRRVPRWYADHVCAVVDAAPPLTAEQREKLRVLLRPATVATTVPSGHKRGRVRTRRDPTS